MSEVNLELRSCPACQVTLVSIDSPGLARCVACGTRFTTGRVPAAAPMSMKAMVSLILGVCSICLSVAGTIPALVLGIWALRDIRRSRGRLTGRAMAYTGIICSVVLALGQGLLIGSVVILVHGAQQSNTSDPAEIERLLTEVVDVDMPEGIQPLNATNVLGMHVLMYGNRVEAGHYTTRIEIQVMPGNWGVPTSQNHAQVRNRLRTERSSWQAAIRTTTEIEGWQIGDRPTDVLRVVDDMPGGQRMFAGYACIAHVRGNDVMVVVRTWPIRAKDGVVLSEPEVRAFLESLR